MMTTVIKVELAMFYVLATVPFFGLVVSKRVWHLCHHLTIGKSMFPENQEFNILCNVIVSNAGAFALDNANYHV